MKVAAQLAMRHNINHLSWIRELHGLLMEMGRIWQIATK